MNRFQRLIAYAAMTAAVFHAALFVSAQQTGNPFINRVPQPGITDAGGATQVNTAGVNNTYGASAVAVSAASNVTDIACLTGSASKKVSISQVTVSGTAASTITMPILLMKRASVNTGGTNPSSGNAVPVAYPYWSTNVASTASVTAYTANPTINDASPGIIGAQVASFTPSNIGVAVPATFQFGNRGGVGQPTLLSAAQQVCVYLGTSSITTGVITVNFEWAEY